jgi:tetratricopeptide (TPR) repeat protein
VRKGGSGFPVNEQVTDALSIASLQSRENGALFMTGKGWAALAGAAVISMGMQLISSAAAQTRQPQGLAATPRNVNATADYRRTSDVTADRNGQLVAQADQSGQRQQPPQYTKEQIEELRKQNERAQHQNALIKQAMEAMTAKNWQAAVAPLQQLIADDPNNWQYHSAMGDVQFGLGAYDQAVDAYEKGIRLAQSDSNSKNPNDDAARKKAAIGKMLTQEGNAYLKLRKNKEAVDAYTKAASYDPNPATAYWNLCATQYNTGNVDGALAACDKAIAADPRKADAYFIKGSLLVGASTTDSSGKITAPPGAAEALKRYLELAPNGPHADELCRL